MRIRLSRCFRRNQQGFSLLELAIGLGAAGLVVGIALQTKSVDKNNPNHKVSQCYQQTRVEMAAMQTALTKYVQLNRMYPQPTSPTESTDYKALSGGFPHDAVGLSTEYASDCFGNGSTSNYMYKVAKEMTTAEGYKNSLGRGADTIGVTIKKTSNDTGTNAPYALISHGASGSCAKKNTANTNCKTDSSAVANFRFDPTPNSNNFFDSLVVSAEFDYQSCSGTVYWNGAAIGDPNATGEACYATIPASNPLAFGSSTTRPSESIPGNATITCGPPDANRKNGLAATGSCGCAAKTVHWNAGDTVDISTGVCSATVPTPLAVGTSSALLNSPAPATGSVTATCRAGVNGAAPSLVFSGATCTPQPCPAQINYRWGTTGQACQATITELDYNHTSGPIPNTTFGLTGTVTATCSTPGGPSKIENATCSPVVCGAETMVSWGECRGALSDAVQNGVTGSVENTAEGYHGNATFICDAGSVNTTNAICQENGTWQAGQCQNSCGNQAGTMVDATCPSGKYCDPSDNPGPTTCSTSACPTSAPCIAWVAGIADTCTSNYNPNFSFNNCSCQGGAN